MADKDAFEIPQQMRDIAEKNIELARTAYGQLMGRHDTGNDGMVIKPRHRDNRCV